jgi:PKD repeat protein
MKRCIFVFLLLLLLSTALFSFQNKSIAETSLIINEVQLSGGTGKSTSEFIELYNSSESEINLETLPLKLHLINSKNPDYGDDNKTLTFKKKVIPPKKYFLITSKNFAEDFEDEDLIGATYSTSGNSLVSDGALYISTSREDKKGVIDFIEFGKNAYFDTRVIPNPSDNRSIERLDFKDNLWHESCFKEGTPGKDNSTQNNCQSPYLRQIKINEIYTEKSIDFVEIKNFSEEKIDIENWLIADSKYSPKIVTGKKSLSSGDFFVFEGDFNMNVSNDSAKIFDEEGRLVDSLDYGKSENNCSYAFDGITWQWTKKISKGKKNAFDKLLSGKIDLEDEIYANVYADFSVETDGAAQKFTWNFGDDHKSYLKNTRHKYEKAGKYAASLKITGDGKTNLLNFTVEVEKFGKKKVRLVSLSPNPSGIDSDNEWISIKNETRKKVNLKGWSIATGSENLYNHPIREDFVIKPGKTKQLTRKICAFSLANKQSKIELRYPDGKVADNLNYDHGKKSIGDNETYAKEKNGWQWVKAPNDTATEAKMVEIQAVPEKLAEIPKTEIIQSAIPENPIEDPQIFWGKFSQDPSWENKQKNRIIFLASNSSIKTPAFLLESQSRVLGVETEKIQPDESSWLEKIIRTISQRINSFLNNFFLKKTP